MARSSVCERSEARSSALSKKPSHHLERRQPTASLGSSGRFAQSYYCCPVLNVRTRFNVPKRLSVSSGGSWPGMIAFDGQFRAAFRAAQLWTLANVGFLVQRRNSFESEARKFLAG